MSGTQPTTTPLHLEGILTFPHLFTPRLNSKLKPGQVATAYYDCTIMVAHGTDLKPFKAAALKIAVEKIGQDKVRALLTDGKLKLGIRTDFATKAVKNPTTFDSAKYQAYISAKTKEPPGIVDRFRDPADPTGKRALPIRDPKVIYAGCKVKISLRPYWFDTDGNIGIGWGFSNIQKIGEGERLDGRMGAQDEFEATEDAPDDLTALPSGAAGQQYSDGGGAQTSSSRDELADLLG